MFFSSSIAFAVDLESSSKSENKANAVAIERSDKIKKEAILIKCNYDDGWGNKIYRVNDEFYKPSSEDDRMLKKIAILKGGSKIEWQQKFGNFSEYISTWQMVQINKNSYKIYMKSPGAPISAYDCISR
jgi:hypothetical protein